MSAMQISGDLAVYLMGLASTWGAVMWRIAALEKKVDKHNNLVERMVKLETRIDEWDDKGR